MITTVEVKKSASESNMNLIRRFSRKMQETGVIQKVKTKRYNQRPQSKLSIKEGTLRRILRRRENTRLFKLGKEIKTRYNK